jgi:redox-sensitive bicupin YhaK (pirin superfamily)
MVTVRRSHERGGADHGWLRARHTFSFASYHDEKFMGFGVLRVLNEDLIEGGKGFNTHGHQDMEIISYVVEGALEHKDSLGNSTLIRPGEVQRMTAGTGVRHSEFNHFNDRSTHLLQIWLLPARLGIEPGYDQKSFVDKFAEGNPVLVGSKDGRQGSVLIHQDVDMYAARCATAAERFFPMAGRKLWVQVIKGDVHIEGVTLQTGDGAGLQHLEQALIKWNSGSEFIVLDLP